MVKGDILEKMFLKFGITVNGELIFKKIEDEVKRDMVEFQEIKLGRTKHDNQEYFVGIEVRKEYNNMEDIVILYLHNQQKTVYVKEI